YAIGGALASSVYGEIRSTYDVDLTLQLESSAPLVEEVLKMGWYITPESAARAAKTGGDFQIIDGKRGLKADCYVTNPTPTSRQRRSLERARLLPYGDSSHTAYFMSPEDVILYNLEWYMMGKSGKHL